MKDKLDKRLKKLTKKVVHTGKTINLKSESNKKILEKYLVLLPSDLHETCFICMNLEQNGNEQKKVKKRITVSHIIKSNKLLHEKEFDYTDYRNTFPCCMDCHIRYEKLSGNPYKNIGKSRLLFLEEMISKYKSLSKLFSGLVTRYKYIFGLEGGLDIDPYECFKIEEIFISMEGIK